MLMILLGVVGLSYAAIQRPDYDDTPNPEFLNPSWMASIPDDRLLSAITMPGTHNAMALYSGVYAECQTWSLASAKFSETYDIYGAVVDHIHRYAHWDLLWHSRLVPTMGEARGKLIILQDFPGPDSGMRYGSMDIADNWRVPTLLHVKEKWQSEHLEAAPAGNMAQTFLTYSSGAGVFAYPRAIAQRINAQLYDYLRAKTDLNQCLGIICMDFPAAPIIQMIIDFQLKEVTNRRQAFNPLSSKASLKYKISSLRKKMNKHFNINV
ncbi:uncharacterized protein LOC121188918 [Toxotes jaculatrix]|uniref:uncharacterized protein LOC121188918 n=1 Tax=Toxotes jaculatrix TaxID=941984 RepID=UPI001B3AC33B|nr:uncharacterized protein LOC121188918 [Toxotes jaculatrix]